MAEAGKNDEGRRVVAGSTAEMLRAHAILCNLKYKHVTSKALEVALQLSIPDALAASSAAAGGAAVSLADLAAALSIPPSKSTYLRRLMRLLIHSDIFAAAATAGGDSPAYFPTPLSSLLVKGSPASLSHFALLGMTGVVSPYEHLGEWLRLDDTLRSPFEMHYGGDGPWGLAERDSKFNGFFNSAMAEDSRLLVGALLEPPCRHVFEGVHSLVDVGGGDGSTAKAIAAAFPGMTCTVLDLPHVVAAAAGNSGDVRFVAGDMFERVPPAEAVLLKWILHDWRDEECVTILRRCKEAVGDGGKIIIIDAVVGCGGGGGEEEMETHLFLDIEMMMSCGGVEREEKEWEAIFADAGLGRHRIMPASLGLRSLIEVYPL